MIKAEIVFKDSSNSTFPKEMVNNFPPIEFFSQWSKGELRRDVEVILEDTEAVENGLNDFKSPEFQLVGAKVFEAWRDLDSRLSLTKHVLAHWQAPEEQRRGGGGKEKDKLLGAKIHNSYDPVIAPEVMKMRKKDKLATEYYTEYYWLTASVVHPADWYVAKDPKEVVRDMVLELLNQWTMRDNATLLLLLNNATTINNSKVCKEFTPNIFSELLTQVSRWAIPVPHFLATAKVFADLVNPDWERFSEGIGKNNEFIYPKWTNIPDDFEHGRIMDVSVACIGSRHDAFYPIKEENDWADMYMLGMPSSLGIRAISISPAIESVECLKLHVEERGWLLIAYIGTAILNARAVAMGFLKKERKEDNQSDRSESM